MGFVEEEKMGKRVPLTLISSWRMDKVRNLEIYGLRLPLKDIKLGESLVSP